MTTVLRSMLFGMFFMWVIMRILPEPWQFEEVMPNWLDRTRLMCATSESQAEKDFWCN
jgi:hypothetical protein